MKDIIFFKYKIKPINFETTHPLSPICKSPVCKQLIHAFMMLCKHGC